MWFKTIPFLILKDGLLIHHKLLCIIFLIFTTQAPAQIILEGNILNENNAVVSEAYILAIPLDKNHKMTFCNSNENGNYKLTLIKGQTYTISVTHISHIPYNIEIKIDEDKLGFNLVLKESINELKEIVITESAPISVVKDTTTFRTSAFSNGKERKLAELLKKLPGITVDRDGNVELNGKKVTHLMVDGKLFFEGGTKLGVNNIPADVADEIEIIEDYHETSFLKGIEASQEIAMNIKLKEDKKNFMFGSIEAGAGIESRYTLKPAVFKYTPKWTSNLISAVNNTNEKVFSLKDYVKFSGAAGTDDISSLFDSNLYAALIQSDYTSSKQQFAGFNSQFNYNKKSEFRMTLIVLNDESDFLNDRLLDFLNQNITDRRTERNKYLNDVYLTKFKYRYTPDKKTVFKTEMILESSSIDQLGTIKSSFLNANIPFDNSQKNTKMSGKINSDWTKKFNESHVFKVLLKVLIEDNSTQNATESKNNIYGEFVPVIDQAFYNITQNQENQIFKTTLHLNHYWKLNRKNHIYFDIKNDFSNTLMNSQAFQELTAGTINNFNGFRNDLSVSHNIYQNGLTYKRIIGNAILDFSLSFQNNTIQINNLETSQLLSSNNIIPTVNLKWDITTKNSISFDYERLNGYPNANNFARGAILNSFNSTFIGNEHLDIQSTQRYGINYAYEKTYGLSFSSRMGYSTNEPVLTTTFDVDSIFRVVTPIQIGRRNDFYTSNIRVNYRKPYYAVRGTSSYRNSQLNNIISNIELTSVRNIFDNDISVQTFFEKYPNIELRSKYTIFNNTISSSKNQQNVFSLNAALNLDYHDWKFSTSYEFRNAKTYGATQSQLSNNNINLNIFYNKEDSLWSFEMDIYNLMNNNLSLQSSFDTTFISETQTFLFPRYAIFKISYKL